MLWALYFEFTLILPGPNGAAQRTIGFHIPQSKLCALFFKGTMEKKRLSFKNTGK